MMETKMFEIRDRGTLIGAIGVRISGDDGALARRNGYQSPCVLLTSLQGGRAFYDPYQWGDRTYKTAHGYIEANWEKLAHGDVVDVEFILGETAAPKPAYAAAGE